MLNRRHLRIKTLQILYAFYQTEDAEYKKFEKELFGSMSKMYDLYIYFLLVFEELEGFAVERIEERKLRRVASQDDLTPNTKFIDNRIIKLLKENQELRGKSESRKINWSSAEKNDLIKKMFLAITESEIFETYMDSEDKSFADDKQFLIELFKTEIANFGLLHDFLENETVYWQDDIDLVCSMVIKTIKNAEEHELEDEINLLPLFRDEEDEVRFVECLMRNIVDRDAENNELINKLTKNWDLDRIAKMDIIILKMAITELIVFPSIPVKVSLNEYIEIAKFYSSPQSKVFINGVLDKSIVVLTNEGLIKKTGRGLLT
ncbi:transcription antitermination factor NusB [Putridiphycobacter roseus]|uniref:Transcription antitermination factor NusB n=1 Tax=Putridiphycobacter roseus TaxID=2219161 RepID=A0A2W1MVB0_9FLAO|nr:transcription antitermination factor NusB [Putridiphycobacter roseus]PZE16029.1 transcription antitermination factor NusB [Putridiphycobacter roseus]